MKGIDGKARTFDVFDESDMRILKLWKKYNFIADEDSPVHIFGDVEYIRKVFYPDTETVEFSEEEAKVLPYTLSLDSLLKTQGLEKPSYDIEVAASAHKEYIKEYRELLGLDKVVTQVSDFESDEDLKSLNVSKSFKDSLKGTNVLLKHNVRNPNVTTLNYKTNYYLASLADLEIRPQLSARALGSNRLELTREAVQDIIDEDLAGKLIELIPENKRTSLAGSLEAILLNSSKAYDFATILADADDKTLEALASKEAVDVVGMIYFLSNYDTIKSETDRRRASIVTEPDRVAATRAAIFDLTRKYLVKVDVTTLPFFNRSINKNTTVSLVGLTGGVIGGGQENRSLAPYSGRYRVVGFKHFISPEDIHSEFSLVRQGLSESSSEFTKSTVKDILCSKLKGEQLYLEKYEETASGPNVISLYDAQSKIKNIKKILKRLGCDPKPKETN